MNFTLGTYQAGKTTVLPVFIGQNVEQLGLTLSDYHGKKKDHVVWFDHNGTRFVVVGLGDVKKFELNKFRDAVAFGARAARKEGVSDVTVLLPEGTSYSKEDLVHTAAEGYVMGEYQFNKYKAKKEESTVNHITIASLDGDLAGFEDALNRGKIYGEGTVIARELNNEPTNKMRPYDLADFVENLFKDSGATVEIFKGEELEKRQYNGLIAVGRGSAHKPAMIKINFQNDKSKQLTALVGKGLTFDVGGYSLKLSRDLSDMRMDMGGAAATVGAMYILTRLNAPVNVVGIIGTCENLIDNNAMLPGEIIEYRNGKTVSVGNTDAEGRLVLADALILSQEIGAERVIDIATLTGACMRALGSKMSGLWANDESVSDAVKQAANYTGEKVWELPLFDEYEDLLYSPIADIANISSGDLGGAITAALFLRNFVGENQKWAHVDMAGPMAVNRSHSFSNEGATGYGARLLAEFAQR
ncbi:leucyl aminopeptidase [Tumebacillus sp. BK434]|uniref:leucyl aminopeptidase family protein n=1 Tax=Tumebacillus sp. BK434 TaxID=2512169 RepID=UPI001051F01B|nr:leucyl aminopeptidase family protein [Tumebacillus sp. BK434]TCP59491.1 leucyl aminopeptidase [Tumebacillus sp. BK434]